MRTARLPLSDDLRSDTGLARGGKLPLRTPPSAGERNARVIFRCSDAEKAALLTKADLAGITISQLMRETLGQINAKRRRQISRTDPALVFQVARIGSNLNQIARWLNASVVTDNSNQIDALVVASCLVAIERALSQLTTPRAWATSEPHLAMGEQS